MASTNQGINNNSFKAKYFILLGIVLLVAFILTRPSLNDTSTTRQVTNAEETPIKIGQAARDGKFEFIVNTIECGKESVGSEYLTRPAQGQFCLLNLSVKNIGDSAQTLSVSAQYLYDKTNKEYSSDGTASSYAGGNWYTDINPGDSITGVLAFDIPKDVVPVSAKLHDDILSNGININLQ